MIKSMKKLLQPCEEDPHYICELKNKIIEDFKHCVEDNLDFPFLMRTVALNPRLKNLKVIES